MQCNSVKFQLGQIEFLNENHEGINAALVSVSVCMFVCMCVHARACVCMCVLLYVPMYVCMYVCLYVFLCVSECLYVSVCMSIYVFCVCPSVCMCRSVFIYVYLFKCLSQTLLILRCKISAQCIHAVYTDSHPTSYMDIADIKFYIGDSVSDVNNYLFTGVGSSEYCYRLCLMINNRRCMIYRWVCKTSIIFILAIMPKQSQIYSFFEILSLNIKLLPWTPSWTFYFLMKY